MLIVIKALSYNKVVCIIRVIICVLVRAREASDEIFVRLVTQVLEGKTQYMEFSGNLVPVLKTGEQLQLPFRAFKENRVPFTARIKDPDAADMMGRIMFMSEPKVPRGELPQTPICTLNILLPEKISPDTATSELDLLELSKNYSFLRDGGISTYKNATRNCIYMRT